MVCLPWASTCDDQPIYQIYNLYCHPLLAFHSNYVPLLHHFYTCDAMLACVLAIVVCLSVCLTVSVCHMLVLCQNG